MTTIKSYSDLDQSRKLAEILPLESADMVLLHEEPYETSDSKFDGLHQALCVPFNKYDKPLRQKYANISYFPCWSLATLLSVIRETTGYTLLGVNNFGVNNVYMSCILGKPWKLETEVYDNEVDACVAMIERLNELNLL